MTIKILIADDEDAIREIVRMTLDTGGYEIVEAADGDTALRLAREHRPRLALLDVSMPGMSGVDVCRALKEGPDGHDIVVLLLTAHAHQDARDRALEAGADGFFTKPFSPLMLLEKIAEYADEM